jgi:tetratricopeptide (TPR) repeat protein
VRSMPPAVRTLLASRIDGLGPGELMVAQCAAIAGRYFSIDAVRALVPADAVTTVERHLGALERRQIVQPTSHGYEFRHHLIQRTAYLATDASTRARLHEQYATWLAAEGGADPTSVDEIIGYHFEQAHDNVKTLGMRDQHARALGVRAAGRLAAAGRRASGRVDMAGAANLMTRALRLLPQDDPQRIVLTLDAVLPLRTAGRPDEAVTTALEAIDLAQGAGDVVNEWRARLELAFVRAFLLSDRAGQEAMRIAEQAVAALTPFGDDQGLAYAWVIIGQTSEPLGELTRAATAYRRALHHAQRSPSTMNAGQAACGLASVLLDGPTPVLEAIPPCRELVEWRGNAIAVVLIPLSGLHALNADFDEARAVLARAARIFRDSGMRRPPIYIAHARGRVELAAGAPDVAEQLAREGLELGASVGGDETDGANALVLAESLCRQRRFDEAEEVVSTYASATPDQDVGRAAVWNAVRAEIRTHRCAWADAVELASLAVAAIDRTELFNLRGELRLPLAAALRGAGDDAGARRAAIEALRLFETKGNVVGLAKARDFLGRDLSQTAGGTEEGP